MAEQPEWYDEGPTMTVPANFFEHLLACLANQKYIGDVNADGMSEGMDVVHKVQQETQAAIDEAYHHGHELLTAALPPAHTESS